MTNSRDVSPTDWRASLADLLAVGYSILGFLTAIDRGAELEIVALVERPDPYDAMLMRTTVDSSEAVVDSLSGLWAGATWHERETRELFGVTFIGAMDDRPLLRTQGSAPMRREALLEARIDTPWPGSAEPGEGRGNPSRRRLLPPGVPADHQRVQS